MTWSYDPTLAADRDKLRFKIGDVDNEDQLLSDETLDTLLSIRPSVTLAAIDALSGILAKLARETDRQALGLGGPRSQKSTHYRQLLAELKAEAAQGSTGVYFGGGSIVGKATLADNASATTPPFRLDQFTNRGA